MLDSNALRLQVTKAFCEGLTIANVAFCQGTALTNICAEFGLSYTDALELLRISLLHYRYHFERISPHQEQWAHRIYKEMGVPGMEGAPGMEEEVPCST